MLFKIGDKIINPNNQPCAIIFNDAEERNKVVEVIAAIKQNPENPELEYWFAIQPKEMFTAESFNAWATLTPEDRINRPRVISKPIIEL